MLLVLRADFPQETIPLLLLFHGLIFPVSQFLFIRELCGCARDWHLLWSQIPSICTAHEGSGPGLLVEWWGRRCSLCAELLTENMSNTGLPAQVESRPTLYFLGSQNYLWKKKVLDRFHYVSLVSLELCRPDWPWFHIHLPASSSQAMKLKFWDTKIVCLQPVTRAMSY